jgi:hypothetical protein
MDGELDVDAHVEPAQSWLPSLFLQSGDFLLDSFGLLGLAVEAGTANQTTHYKEEAAELKGPDMTSFTASDGVDPDGCDIQLNLRQGGLGWCEPRP